MRTFENFINRDSYLVKIKPNHVKAIEKVYDYKYREV